MNKTDKLINWEADEKQDLNVNGIEDGIEPPPTDIGAGIAKLAERFRENPNTDPRLSGGDVDARWEAAESEGEETVGGSHAIPGQNVVDEIGGAMGVTYDEGEVLKVGEKERSRDLKRWELDPASSEDYQERAREEK